MFDAVEMETKGCKQLADIGRKEAFRDREARIVKANQLLLSVILGSAISVPSVGVGQESQPQRVTPKASHRLTAVKAGSARLTVDSRVAIGEASI